ncbi:MAG: ectoine hydrolase DoeA, partial [Synergistetes bacterium HGW-Synergistetes-2]
MLLFPASEYAERLAKTKERMHEHGVEVLIVSHPANMNYLTGYDGWSFYVHQGLIVSLDCDEPVWFGREQDGNAARILTSLKEENVKGYPDHYVMSKLRHPMQFVADILRERGWDARHVGVEMEGYYFTAEGFQSLRRELPKAVVKDGTLVVNLVRRIKSAREIEYVRQAARIAENVMKTALDVIAPGVRENDAAAEVYKAQIAGT